MNDPENKKLAFWNQMSERGENSGTQDFILQNLEEKVILENIGICKRVLDVGCGDANLLHLIQSKTAAEAYGVDFSENMIGLAKNRQFAGKATFVIGDMSQITYLMEPHFDLIVSKRSLINLDAFAQQLSVFNDIISLLQPGGFYFMLENVKEGLDRLNQFRIMLDLHEMKVPWHNRYFSEAEIEVLKSQPRVSFVKSVCFSSTYYLISRVLHAKISALNDKEPKYDSVLNQLSLAIPSVGDLGAPRLFIFKKV